MLHESVIVLLLGIAFAGTLLMMVSDPLDNEKIGQIGACVVICEMAALAAGLIVLGVVGLFRAVL